ncbi:SDR family NAD(P)-dependent oxidoreductase [Marinobacter sp. TBZ242]|uniref:SDR family NAD(P)-dependent oxidoreductase n=1 Tax=Marinobacter azerbaijanicus TaxID=3050455 RepID=A0ABT7I6B5_9GAMM|nr:SDR family NAD(P)-dependent oxidoreductase [Marinobacter sp. TBZ242]MDL0429565.1 SDR family NAD(P)-dependent oxidoreductase [Marinobacter sp. TBZ242]
MSQRLEITSNIWITGASSGIGEAVTRELMQQGHRLVITGRRQEALEQLCALAPERMKSARADTTRREDLSAIGADLEAFGNLDMAILNAGACEYLEIADYDSSVIDHNITTNVVGTARCLDIALPALRRTAQQGRPATLVIVSSSAWWFPFGRAEGYGASKAALTYFAHALRADLASEGIDVVVVSPGFVKTPLTDRNDFPMPFLVSAEDAATRIVTGLRKGRMEIAFPKRFTWTLKLLGALPQGVIDRIAASMSRQSRKEQESNG